LVPTIQRVAVLDCLEGTKDHPTADQILATIRETFPSVSRATVYNTLEALSTAGIVLKITVDPAVARYDADLDPHAHFRCRICNRVYDIMMDKPIDLDASIEGHHVEAVRAYAYGVCKDCLTKTAQRDPKALLDEPPIDHGSASAQPAQRNPQGFSNEPTRCVEKKALTTLSLSDSPSELAQRSLQGFSNEPTKEVRNARTS